MTRFTRRDVLKFGAIAGGSLLLPLGLQKRSYAGNAGSPNVTRFSLPFRSAPVLNPVRSDATTDYYQIRVNKTRVNIIPGLSTEVFSYNGTVPGPTIKQRKDRQSVVRFVNDSIGTPTSTHLHGMASLPQYDGYAEDLIPPGYYKDYIYPNNRAATLWYHDHAIHRTARNVYQGLAATYIVQDDLELGLPLPKGAYDVSLMIQDVILSPNGSLVYDDDGQDSLMGDIITVNGVPWPRMEVANRKYRFRVLNGSLSRSYRLALSNGSKFTMIGTDAGLMGSPVEVANFRLGMAERYEFVIDFSKYPVGTKIVLQNLSLPNNEDYDNTGVVMRFDVVRQEPDDSSVPSTLRPYSVIPTSSAVRTREFRYERSNGLWVINGKVWDVNRIDANPQVGDVEIWRLYNNSGGWFHPIHVHLIDAQIIDRNGRAPFPYERGFKDVFYVGENESVRVIGKFGPHTGKYMSHCHNSVHEDHDMMNQFQVGTGGPDPVTAAPARSLPAPPL
ncbi:multicopper oxidase family protein [Trichocoleus sp. FACHB-262]|uniref:multicopper oxidase family protein n=1 Tax=Trichocoleus sp. FACHB-262 TaxID=2692869 RepID=UPI0016852DF0|nr:multicopper oxidase domain-containing protein [Trichocoleus sp. FACHB-262]MBD2124784.1 multicopper oxidase domain-containing protein [Trichocoleus sp. FACHB-262]